MAQKSTTVTRPAVRARKLASSMTTSGDAAAVGVASAWAAVWVR
jgi:hypothetical protein